MEFMKKRNEALKKQEELYADDEPYDSQMEETGNEDA
jgi:hypothetical protein